MDIQQKAFRPGAEKNIFDSHQARYLTGGVTIDRETVPENPERSNKRIIEIGEILGRINASGKYGPYDPAATDGRETARCILVSTLDCTEYDQVSGAVDHGFHSSKEVLKEDIPVQRLFHGYSVSIPLRKF